MIRNIAIRVFSAFCLIVLSAVALAIGCIFSAVATSLFTGLSCGIEADGSPWCWGTGFGFGTKGPTASSVPLRWDNASSVAWAKLVLGQGHACGLDAAGHAWCVGSAAYGLLGDGAGLASATPVAVAGGRVYRDIAVGMPARIREPRLRTEPERAPSEQRLTGRQSAHGTVDSRGLDRLLGR